MSWISPRSSYGFKQAIRLGLGGFGLVAVMGLSACEHMTEKSANNTYEGGGTPGVVDPKYTLKADRELLEEIRKDIPQDVQAQNDEAAFIKHLLGDGTRKPEVVRRTFDTHVRNKRAEFDRDHKDAREAFHGKNKKERDAFLGKLSQERSRFNAADSDRKTIQDFHKGQDERRRTYFANEKERTNDFEAQHSNKRKNFEDYMKTKTAEFNAEMKIYHRDFEARAKDQKKKEIEAQDDSRSATNAE